MPEVLAGGLSLRQTVLWSLLQQCVVRLEKNDDSGSGIEARLYVDHLDGSAAFVVKAWGQNPAAALQNLAEEIRSIIEDVEP